MNIGIYSNLTRDINGKAAIKIASYLQKKGIAVACCSHMESLSISAKLCSKKELAMHSDIIIVLGGDGTILRIVQECAKFDCKIFAINLGNIGFLTEIEDIEIEKGIELILNNEYEHDDRILLDVSYKDKHYYALNEAVIARGAQTKMVKIKLRIDEVNVDIINSDGIIVSSPTGSTAYSLSAGGPVIDPSVSAFCLTPISPHSLQSRPIVISDEKMIEIELLNASPCACLNIDGEDISTMEIGEKIRIKKSSLIARFIRFDDYNFYRNLMKKLNFWGRPEKENL